MTKEEIKAIVAVKIAGQGTNVDGGGALSGVLNAIIDTIPESGVMPEPKYDLNGVAHDIGEEGFAKFLGISIDKLPDFFKESVIRYGDYILTRVYYSDDPQNDAYRAIWGGKTGNYGATVEIDLSEHNVITEFDGGLRARKIA